MKKNRQIIFFIILFSLSGCYQGDELPPDQKVWQYDLPSSFGLDNDRLLNIDSIIKEGVFEETNAVIILKEDKIIFENYYDFSSRTQLRSLGRNTYTILISLLGSYIEEGWINSLDDPIMTYLPEYEEIFSNNTDKSSITLRHLLNNRSGLVWNESVISSSSDESHLKEMKLTEDWTRFVLDQAQEAQPGLRLVFNSGHAMILAKIMQNANPDISLEEYFKINLFDKIGIKNYLWENDPSGILNATDGLRISTFDWLRFGRVMMNEGRWIDKTRVISEDWYFEIKGQPQLMSQYYSYNYGWYQFTPDLFEAYNIPEQELLLMAGDLGENLYLLPEQDMIIVIHGENYFYSFFNPSLSLFARIMGLFDSNEL